MDMNQNRNIFSVNKSDLNSAIMESIDYPSLGSSRFSTDGPKSIPPDVITNEFTSLKLGPRLNNGNVVSFLLLDGREQLKVTSQEQFLNRLGCDASSRVKVVSVFGKTGDGKSHTLNHTFFDGEEVFKTSSEQDSCTLGVWSAYDANLRVICLDTEGLLGTTSHENQRTRLLLKVLAVSDIVIYRTRSERLTNDLFTFLGSASRAYSHHFHSALQSVGQRRDFRCSQSALGPAVVIFHETRHTRLLPSSLTESAEDNLRIRFAQNNLEIEAFSSLKYIGTQTEVPPTNFSELRIAIQTELENTTVRSARSPQVVYHTLKLLNDKFNGEIENVIPVLFPDQYFTCPTKCLSCERRCELSMGHIEEEHSCAESCRYQHQYENCIYICKVCYCNGKRIIVQPKFSKSTDTSWFGIALYAWSGYVIECPNCGEIYRSRQYWYGNKNPEDSAVRTEITHVWPGYSEAHLNSQYTAQKLLDGVSYLSEAVASVGTPPTRMLSSWVADQIAPKYWRPNHEIKHCHKCKTIFGSNSTKHHCRACGEGFCELCSAKTMPVPDKGWDNPVRVCDVCYAQASGNDVSNSNEDIDDTEVRARKYGEVVVSTISTVASVLEYPKGLIKETARPSYWVPDHKATHCCCCEEEFGPRRSLHHCRDCGQGVCQDCSPNRRPVLYRGWTKPVRVCKQCMKKD